MTKRIVSSIIGFPIIAVCVILGGFLLQMGLLLLSLIGMYEIFRAFSSSNKKNPLHFVAYFFAIIYYVLLDDLNSFIFLVLLSLFVLCIMFLFVFFYTKVNFLDCLTTIFGFFYVSVLMSFIYLVRSYNYGEFFVWLIFICAWGSDTGAYFIGTTFGKHKLAPVLSPNKTIEGAIGGFVGATIIGIIYASVVQFTFRIPDLNIIAFCAVIAFIGSIFALFGDLSASAIKRYTNIKDYGTLIPGHGGIVDRFDSILFTAPIVYAVMFVLLNYM